MTDVVGVVGLGNMGRALAASLADRGRALVVHDAAAADRAGGSRRLGELTAEVWRRFADEEPGDDFTRIYAHVRGPRRRTA